MKLDVRTLLQVDATGIVGVLLFLTLSNLESSVAPLLLTAIIVFPFGISASALLFLTIVTSLSDKIQQRLVYIGKFGALAGFLYLMVVLVILLLGWPDVNTQEEICAKDPMKYNLTWSWECSFFSQGSLAEKCAKDPQQYQMNLSGCTRFIHPR